jgi:hypothetical protein
MTGRLIMSQPITADIQMLDIRNIDAGIYTVSLRDINTRQKVYCQNSKTIIASYRP